MDTVKQMLQRLGVFYDHLPSSSDKWLRVAVIALPLLLLVALLFCFAVNVPFWDQWELVPLLQKHHQGTLGFSDFFAQHNEHRLLFPRLIMVSLALISGWNTYWEVATSVILAAVGIIFLYKILHKTIGHRLLRLLALASISLVLFSPLQQENWMWGWQIQWYLCVLGLIVAVWALAAWEVPAFKRVVVAALAAVVATYSLASGMFVWLVCLPLLWFIRPLRRWLPVWLVLMIAAVGLYYIGYVDPAYHPSKTLFLHEPLSFVRYVLVYIAHPVVVDFLWSLKMALVYLGAIIIGLGYLWKYHRRELTTSLLPWLCLGVYACLAAASTGISRLGFGVEQAYSSRYTTMSQFLLLAFVVILYKIIEREFRHGARVRALARNGAMVALLFCMLFVSLNYAKGAVQMRLQSAYLHKVRHCAQTAATPSDECLLKLYPNQEVVWQRLQYLRGQHLGGL